MKTLIKTPTQIKNITESCKYLNELLYALRDQTKAGITLLELEEFADQWIKKRSLKGAFKGYEGFPANLCLSVNDCVVHGIPDETILKNGDLLKIDAGLIYEKGVSDSAISVIVGDASANPLGAELIRATKASLDRGVDTIKVGGFAYDYAKTVHNTIINEGFRVLKSLSGHGVGTDVHEMPLFLNYPAAAMKKIQWTPGMVVALEPITAVESDDVVYHDINDWNLYCRKGDLGAQWEYTILITENGPEILAGVTEDWY